MDYESPQDVAGTNANGDTVTAGDNVYVFTVRGDQRGVVEPALGIVPGPSNVPTGSRLMNADQEVTFTVTDLGGEYRMQFAKAPTVTAVRRDRILSSTSPGTRPQTAVPRSFTTSTATTTVG